MLGRRSAFYVHFHERPLRDYRDVAERPAETALRRRLFDRLITSGINISSLIAGNVSTPMTEVEVDFFLERLGDAVAAE